MQRLDILHPSIDDYLLDITPERDEVLTEMEAHARANRFPIVGPLVGRVLHQLVLITNPTRIFEMGSGFGYSAYWMAKALQEPEASIICTDGSQENADRAAGYLARGGIADRIDYRVGNALEIIDETEGEFDIIYTTSTKTDIPKPSARRFHDSEAVDYLLQITCYGWDMSLRRNPVVLQRDLMNGSSGFMLRQSELEN